MTFVAIDRFLDVTIIGYAETQAQQGQPLFNNRSTKLMIISDKILDKANSQTPCGYIAIKELPHGAFFKRKENSKKVFQRGDYYRPDKQYEGNDWEDIGNSIYLNPNKLVFIDFEF